MQIISGLYKGRKIVSPKGQETRPTSGRLREALFNICQGDIEGARFLDLFAGSGAMGLEALSRGARMATFVDNSRESIRCIQANIKTFGVDAGSQVVYGDVFDMLQKLAKRGNVYDLIYADPPYAKAAADSHEKASSAKVVELVDALIDKGAAVLSVGGSVFIEDAAGVLLRGGGDLKHLVLEDARKMGRSGLQHWIRTS